MVLERAPEERFAGAISGICGGNSRNCHDVGIKGVTFWRPGGTLGQYYCVDNVRLYEGRFVFERKARE